MPPGVWLLSAIVVARTEGVSDERYDRLGLVAGGGIVTVLANLNGEFVTGSPTPSELGVDYRASPMWSIGVRLRIGFLAGAVLGVEAYRATRTWADDSFVLGIGLYAASYYGPQIEAWDGVQLDLIAGYRFSLCGGGCGLTLAIAGSGAWLQNREGDGYGWFAGGSGPRAVFDW